MDTLFLDLRLGLRALVRSPGFSAAAALALALGIGASCAMFAFCDAMLLHPFPFPTDRLTIVNQKSAEFDRLPAPTGLVLSWKERARSFDAMAPYQWWEMNVTGGDEPEHAIGYRVDPAFFSLLDVRPALGRALLDEEAAPGREHVVVLSWELWQRRFGGDAHLVDKPVTLDGESYVVVGVMGKEFRFPEAAQFWLPAALTPEEKASPAGRFRAVGRLRPGVSLGAAQRELAELQREFEASTPLAQVGTEPNPFFIRDYAETQTQLAIWVLVAAGALLLLIACANVGNMLLARSMGRAREIAIRAAMGASRWRVVRQLLVESVVLTLAASCVGLLFAAWGIDLIHAMVPPVTARFIAGWDHIGIDGRVLGFGLAAACLTTVISGLAPALHASRLDLQQVLQRETRASSAGRERRRLRSALLLGETMLALILAVCAGLLVRTFVHQISMSYGFDSRQVLTAQVSLAGEKYRDGAARIRFHDEAVRRLQGLAGVEAVATVSDLPLSGSTSVRGFTLEGALNPDPHRLPTAVFEVVGPGVFRALRIPLLAGRLPADSDDARAPFVAVVSESLARRHFGSAQAALGHRFRLDDPGNPPPRTIVGVVPDAHLSDLRDLNREALYIPYGQQPQRGMAFVVRTTRPPMTLAADVRREILAIDRDQPVEYMRTMEQMLDDNTLLGPRITTQLLGVFALISLLLTAVGIYGVMAYSVARRTQEIGIRLALGAQPSAVLALVVRQGMAPALLGIALGIVCALGATRGLQELLLGVSPLDPLTFASVPAFLFLVAVFASWLPARRAIAIDPASTLRAE
jgi:putative ABC transport system permease protein